MKYVCIEVSEDKWNELMAKAELIATDQFLYINDRRQLVVEIKPVGKKAEAHFLDGKNLTSVALIIKDKTIQ